MFILFTSTDLPHLSLLLAKVDEGQVGVDGGEEAGEEVRGGGGQVDRHLVMMVMVMMILTTMTMIMAMMMRAG